MRAFSVWGIVTLGLWLGASTPGAAQSAGSEILPPGQTPSWDDPRDPPRAANGDVVFTRGSGPRRPRVDQTRQDPAGTGFGLLSDRPRIRPTYTETPPVIDGRLDDPIWQTAAMIINFVQQSPLDGVAATEDTEVYALLPHTHLRGKRWEYELVYPDGRREPVLSVPTYDFNWQIYYQFEEPLTVPKGARLEASAWYDNSAANRSNPDPTTDVRWGEQTWEEMHYTAITYRVLSDSNEQ